MWASGGKWAIINNLMAYFMTRPPLSYLLLSVNKRITDLE